MRTIDADALKELFSEVIGHIAKKPEINGNLEHMIRASAMVIQMIDDAPTVQPDTTTHESIPAETGKNDEDRTNGDCISRQQAIDTLRKMQTYKMFAGDDMLLIDQAEAQTELMMLPSTQPVQRWVPCSERLPEIDKEVLVTDGDICWVCSLFDSQDIEDGLYLWEDNYGHWHEFEEWVAWMPLPEIYQEGGEHK